jgi:hypothetical protein
MEEKKINNLDIKIFKNKNDNKKILHKDLINIPYFLLYIAARKGCGKTNILSNIVFLCGVPKFTKLRIFSTTT